MIVDTSAVIALVMQEPDHAIYSRCLALYRGGSIAAPNWLEAMMVVEGRKNFAARVAMEELLRKGTLRIAEFKPIHADLALTAWRNYGKGRHPAALNFGDCMAYGLARAADEPLLYKGNDFAQTDIVSALA